VVSLGFIKQTGFYLFGIVTCFVGLLICVEGSSVFNDNLVISGFSIALIGIIIMVYAKTGLSHQRNKKVNYICSSINEKCRQLDNMYNDIDRNWKKIDKEWKKIDDKLDDK
jgi:hypothetical protein